MFLVYQQSSRRVKAVSVDDASRELSSTCFGSSWDTGIGAEIERGKADFKSLEAYMLIKGEASPNRSGRQEMLEHLNAFRRTANGPPYGTYQRLFSAQDGHTVDNF